jgi:hypothetical protein
VGRSPRQARLLPRTSGRPGCSLLAWLKVAQVHFAEGRCRPTRTTKSRHLSRRGVDKGEPAIYSSRPTPCCHSTYDDSSVRTTLSLGCRSSHFPHHRKERGESVSACSQGPLPDARCPGRPRCLPLRAWQSLTIGGLEIEVIARFYAPEPHVRTSSSEEYDWREAG